MPKLPDGADKCRPSRPQKLSERPPPSSSPKRDDNDGSCADQSAALIEQQRPHPDRQAAGIAPALQQSATNRGLGLARPVALDVARRTSSSGASALLQRDTLARWARVLGFVSSQKSCATPAMRSRLLAQAAQEGSSASAGKPALVRRRRFQRSRSQHLPMPS